MTDARNNRARFVRVRRLSAKIEQAALTLANAEGRAKNSVLNDLFLADADVVSVRYADDGQDGSMPVDAYLSIVAESRNMLMAAACSAIRPQRDFQNMSKVKMALKYLKSARVAQSGQDGCAIKLMTFTPSEYPDGASGGGEADQFPGKVMNKLASGLATTRQAIDLADLDTDAQSFDSRVDEGMSANLCDAVTGLLGKKDDSVIDVSISWALTGAKSGKRVGVRFDGSDARALRAASKILRGDFQN